VVSRILAFRPARVAERLGPRSSACALSAREVLDSAAALRLALPVIRAPVAAVARAALVAAKEQGSALGLVLAPELRADRWFDAVACAADELAGRVPVFLAAELVVAGGAVTQVDAAVRAAWVIADAGMTDVWIDASAVAATERARVVTEVAAPALERGLGLGLGVVVPLADAAASGGRPALAEALAAGGVLVDALAVTCPAPRDASEARAQAGALARVAAGSGRAAVVRRGPVSPELLAALAGVAVRAVEDGGAAAERAGADEGEAAEARVYVEVSHFIESLGASGSAAALTRALERRLTDRTR
jgi:hypothetical protein